MKRLDVSTQQGYKSKWCITIQKSAGNVHTHTHFYFKQFNNDSKVIHQTFLQQCQGRDETCEQVE